MLMFTCCTCSLHAAVVISTADGSGADTYIQYSATGNPPFENFGASASLNIKNDLVAAPNQYTRKLYIRFDLSSTAELVTSSRLNLTVTANDIGGAGTDPGNFVINVYGLNDGDPDENWIEGNGGSDNDPPGEIVWNNAPGNLTSSAAGFVGSETTWLGSFNVTTNDTNRVTVSFSSAALSTFLNDDTDNLVTLMLSREEDEGKNLSFYSKEYSDGSLAPKLDLNYVPEPGTLALIGLGLGLFGSYRMRGHKATRSKPPDRNQLDFFA